MDVADDLLRNNERYAARFDKGELARSPSKHLVVITCMDARLDLYGMLGLREGEAHVIRNAGGVVTDDVIRSLTISQRLLGTREIVVVYHTDCGMLTFRDDDLKGEIEADVGIRPPFALEAFSDPEADVRQSIARIKASPFVLHKDGVHGFVYHVETGRLSKAGT